MPIFGLHSSIVKQSERPKLQITLILSQSQTYFLSSGELFAHEACITWLSTVLIISDCHTDKHMAMTPSPQVNSVKLFATMEGRSLAAGNPPDVQGNFPNATSVYSTTYIKSFSQAHSRSRTRERLEHMQT